MKPINVYLCDLTRDTAILVSDVIPINIGYSRNNSWAFYPL